MAIDQQTILQLLTQLQGGGESLPAAPVSGIGGGTPLSGLPLGEQGMGLGGGGSLLGGSAGLGGGAGGPGLDLLHLLDQLTQGAGTPGAPDQGLLAGVGGGVGPSIGGGTGSGVGAGGPLLPPQGGVPQGTLGQAGAGGGQSAAAILGLLKAAVGIGTTLFGVPPTASPTGGSGGPTGSLPNIPPDLSLGGSLGQSPFFGGGLTPPDLSLLTGTQPLGGTGLTPGDLSLLTGTTPPDLLAGIGTPGQLLSLPGLGGLPGFPAGAAGLPAPGGGTFSAAGNILPSIPGLGGLPAFPAGAAGLAAPGGGTFSAAGNILPDLSSLGAGGAIDVAGGGTGTLLSAGNILPGLGVLGNIGSGILGLTQGNTGGGAGTLGGTAAGLGLGALLSPGTFGLSLLLGGLGGSAGGLLGSLLGGLGQPSIYDARRANVGPTAQAGLSALTGALRPGIQSLNELITALGIPTPDTFGAPRNPVAVSLAGPGGNFEFNPARVTDPSRLVTPDMFSQFLGEVRAQIPDFQVSEQARQEQFARDVAARQAQQAAFDANIAQLQALGLDQGALAQKGARPPDLPGLPAMFPTALNRILGSGDVAFQSQAGSEALAGTVANTARQAILNFILENNPIVGQGP